VAQTAAGLVLEPIFEADLPDEQHAYRRGRGALDAVKKVHALLNNGHTEVVDADLSGYFDSIPHVELMKSVARRISDGQMLKLIKMWLVMPVEETDDRGRKQRTTRAKDTKRGTPQGAPISPLLSNLYMRRFVLGWKVLGHEKRLDAHIVNYADDFVICCRGTAEAAHRTMQDMMERLKLTVNTAKTRTCRMPEDTFDFLGYTLGRCYSPRTGRSYIGTRPSKKRIVRMFQAISEVTRRRTTLTEAGEKVGELNRMLIGWANYFCLGTVSPAYRAVDAHARKRLRQWLCGKHQRAGQGAQRYSDGYLHADLGLAKLAARTHIFPWAKA
jgi:group II intron reverse transcriptase/maturase